MVLHAINASGVPSLSTMDAENGWLAYAVRTPQTVQMETYGTDGEQLAYTRLLGDLSRDVPVDGWSRAALSPETSDLQYVSQFVALKASCNMLYSVLFFVPWRNAARECGRLPLFVQTTDASDCTAHLGLPITGRW